MRIDPFGWDKSMFLGFNGLGRDTLDYLCAWPTHFGDPLVLPFVALVYMLIWDEGKVVQKFCTVFIASIGASIASTGMKALIYRPRPYVFYQDVIHADTFQIHSLFGLLEKESSLPSGHSTVIFAGITTLLLLYGRRLWPLYLVGLFIGFTRVYVGVHFPTDILAGALLGVAVGCAAYVSVFGPRSFHSKFTRGS